MKTIGENKGINLSHRIILLIVLGLVSLVWLGTVSAQTRPGWKERWDKALNGAKREGRVVVFGPPGELIRQAMSEEFRKTFPDISIEYSGARGEEHATRLRAERDGGIYSADVLLSGTSTATIYMKPMRALDLIEPVLILPEVTETKYWRNNRLEFADAEGKYNLVFANVVRVPVIYDPQQVKVEEIDQLYELLDPKWKGKIVINDPVPSGPGKNIFGWIWEVLGPQKAADYYRKIRAQAGAVDRDQRRQIEWVAQGKYPILLAPSSPVGQQLLKRGLKFGILPEFKDYGAPINVTFGSAMLINRAPHPNAAAVFINWLLSKEGQTAWSKATNDVSQRLDVPTDHLPPYIIPRPGGKYWIGYYEKNVERSPGEEAILKELFHR